MNKCEREGSFPAEIVDVGLIQHRFNHQPDAMEIRLDFMDEEGNAGRLYLSISTDYITGGNNKGERECDVTTKTLAHFEIDLSAGEVHKLPTLKGRKVSVYGKRNAKGFVNFWLNTSTPETAVDVKDAAARIKALFGGAAPAASPSPAAKLPGYDNAKSKAANLFAKPVPKGDEFNPDLDGPSPF